MSANRKRKPWQLSSGEIAAQYLFWKLGYPLKDFGKFWDVIKAACKRDKGLYRKMYLLKKSGKMRLILIPCPELKKVQQAIDREILAYYDKYPSAFGFSGGSIRDALGPIVQANQPIFCADVKDAFPQTSIEAVFQFFRSRSFGFNTAYFLAHLTTWNYVPHRSRIEGKSRQWVNGLPQGAPSSPRLFDLCFEPLDKKLSKFVAKIGGVYTRYADNLFVTAPTFWPKGVDCDCFDGWGKTVPVLWHSPPISAVYQIVANRSKGYWKEPRIPSYRLHKAFLADSGQILHALGLNLIDGQLHNKRDFKRRLRLVLYNLEQALICQDDFVAKIWPLYQQIQGMMQFAVKETLPVQLIFQWEKLALEVMVIRYAVPSET